jgi:hypothetical protein
MMIGEGVLNYRTFLTKSERLDADVPLKPAHLEVRDKSMRGMLCLRQVMRSAWIFAMRDM